MGPARYSSVCLHTNWAFEQTILIYFNFEALRAGALDQLKSGVSEQFQNENEFADNDLTLLSR
jgi:hypothetical protein